MKKCNHAYRNLVEYKRVPGLHSRNIGAHFLRAYCPKCNVRKHYREDREGKLRLLDSREGPPKFSLYDCTDPILAATLKALELKDRWRNTT